MFKFNFGSPDLVIKEADEKADNKQFSAQLHELECKEHFVNDEIRDLADCSTFKAVQLGSVDKENQVILMG